MALTTETSPLSPCVLTTRPSGTYGSCAIGSSAEDLDLDLPVVRTAGSARERADGLDDAALTADHLADVRRVEGDLERDRARRFLATAIVDGVGRRRRATSTR